MATTKINQNQFKNSTTPGSLIASDASNIFTIIAPTTGADRIPFYDDSATAIAFLSLGTNLSISGTTLNATAGAGGYATVQEEGSTVGASNTTINFIGAGLTAADAGGGVTSVTVDATLNALASYNTNGFLVQTAADTFAGRSLTAPAAGITISNNDGVSGNPTFALANDLSAVEGLSTSGIAVRTGSDTWNTRTITGTTNRVTVTNGDGVSGNPTLDVGSEVAILSENETVSGSWTFSNNIVLNGSPSLDTHVATLGTVKSYINGLDPKNSVRVATTANGTLATAFENGDTVDGVTLATGDRILLKDQTTQAENGIYTVNASGAPTRATDMDAWSEVPGAYVAVEEGTANADTVWLCTSNQGGTLGTTAITWTKWKSAGAGVDGSGAQNKIAYWSDSDSLTSDTNLHYESNQLLIGTTTLETNNKLTTKGGGTADTTFGYRHLNSSNSKVFSVADDGTIVIGASSALTLTNTTISRSGDINISPGSQNDIFLNTGNGGFVRFGSNFTWTSTSGTQNALETTMAIVPSSGTGVFNGFSLAQTINQTGGANGITRGIYINPTLTAAADYRGLEITANSSHYAIYTTAGKVRFDLGSDATGDIYHRGAGGELLRLGAGASGRVLTANGAGAAPSWEVAASGLTITVGYVTGTGTDTYDLDAGVVVKDIDGTGFAFTVPTNLDKVAVYRNGVMLSRSGTVSRDYTLTSATGVLVLATSLASDETLKLVKFD